MPNEHPTESDLDQITTWQTAEGKHFHDLFDFIRSVWWCPDWGFNFDEKTATYHLSTGGWSGNEDIIEATQKNFIFWSLWWESTRRGGHYVFRHINSTLGEESK